MEIRHDFTNYQIRDISNFSHIINNWQIKYLVLL